MYMWQSTHAPVTTMCLPCNNTLACKIDLGKVMVLMLNIKIYFHVMLKHFYWTDIFLTGERHIQKDFEVISYIMHVFVNLNKWNCLCMFYLRNEGKYFLKIHCKFLTLKQKVLSRTPSLFGSGWYMYTTYRQFLHAYSLWVLYNKTVQTTS